MALGGRVYVAGHGGLVGSALVRRLAREGLAHPLILRARAELDLTRQEAVERFFGEERPELVFLAAALVGGIRANNERPAEFIRQNLLIEANVIEAARRAGVRRLVFLGASCIYPKDAPQPMREDCLLTGPLEPTSEPYAIAKIAGVKLCQSYNRQYGTRFIVAMPASSYGPGDNFDPEDSHVIPAMILKIHQAKLAGAPSVTFWGTGRPLREFIHADDLADALVTLMGLSDEEFDALTGPGAPLINIGTGEEVGMAELAGMIARVLDYRGKVEFDPSRPDGTQRRVVDASRIRALGWRARIPLEEGLKRTVEWYLSQHKQR